MLLLNLVARFEFRMQRTAFTSRQLNEAGQFIVRAFARDRSS
jgi:hypothetical protein